MDIIGHQKIIGLLDRSVEKKALSHAYLFAGPEHAGKFTVALGFAQKLLGNGSTSSPRVNPDLIVVKPEIEEKKGVTKKKDIKIEDIRDLQHRLSLAPQSGRYKTAIVDEADRMNKAAQNSLLKTLEEANPGVVIILITHDERRLLPTIISRCQRMKFGTVPDEELGKNIADKDMVKEILFWSLGRPGLMRRLLGGQDELDRRREASRNLKNLLAQSVAEKFAFAEELAKNQDALLDNLDFWTVLLRENILRKDAGFRAAPEKALLMAERINQARETLKDTNANARLVLENLFLNF